MQRPYPSRTINSGVHHQDHGAKAANSQGWVGSPALAAGQGINIPFWGLPTYFFEAHRTNVLYVYVGYYVIYVQDMGDKESILSIKSAWSFVVAVT